MALIVLLFGCFVALCVVVAICQMVAAGYRKVLGIPKYPSYQEPKFPMYEAAKSGSLPWYLDDRQPRPDR